MSAFTQDRGTPVIPINSGYSTESIPYPASDESSKPRNSSAIDQLEAVVVATRQLEANLAQERFNARNLKEEIKRTQDAYERLVNAEKAKTHEISNQAGRLQAMVVSYQEHERKVSEKVEVMSRELDKYKSAWSNVVQREKEANQIKGENERRGKRVQELERELGVERQNRGQNELQVRNAQAEMQSLSSRLIQAEARAQDSSRELRELKLATEGMKRDLEEAHRKQLAKIEAELRDRFKTRARAEIERLVQAERAKFSAENQKVREDLARAIQELATTQRDLKATKPEVDRMTLESRQARDEARQARAEGEAAKSQLQNAVARSKSFERALITERQRAEDAMQALQVEIEALRGSGLMNELLKAREEERDVLIRQMELASKRKQRDPKQIARMSELNEEIKRLKNAASAREERFAEQLGRIAKIRNRGTVQTMPPAPGPRKA